jgi:restriction endonuclease S subunit
MTKEQIEILRRLIRGEIEAAFMNEKDYRFAYVQEEANEQGWETFKKSFDA